MKEIIYNENKTKDEYFNDGFKEVKLSVAKQYT